MVLQSILLQNFRSYSQKKIDFSDQMTVIVGLNTAGKTNLVEAIMLLATGKSFRADKDTQMICFGEDIARVQGLVQRDSERIKLEVVIAQGAAANGRLMKKYLVNGVPRGRIHFVGNFPAVLFRPEELDIIIDGPSVRREFLNNILEPIDFAYRSAKLTYDKALRQRNALLDVVRDTGIRNTEQFAYWDNLLITNGGIITQKRQEVIEFINKEKKDVFDFTIHYDNSIISSERLFQYKDAEIASANTLVGPQRDDFFLTMQMGVDAQNVQQYGSRGQQRLVVLQLKLLHIAYVEKVLAQKPLLILDDIFSELDSNHIALVMEKVTNRQVILTTTHKEFVNKNMLGNFSMVELGK